MPIANAHTHARATRGRGVLVALVWVGVPAGWLVLTGLAGTSVAPDQVLLQIAILVVFGVGLPWSVIRLSRLLLHEQLATGSVRGRRPVLRELRAPAVPEAPRPPRVSIGACRRAASLLVLAAMFVASVAVWTAIPVAWLWIGSHLASSSQPGLGPYVIVIAGIPFTIVAVVWGLYRCDALYSRLTRRELDRSAPPAWRKSLTDTRQRRPWTTVDAVMTVSVIVAVIGLLVWFAVFADHHSIVEPYLGTVSSA